VCIYVESMCVSNVYCLYLLMVMCKFKDVCFESKSIYVQFVSFETLEFVCV
jgi:hypothetical protein